MYDIAIDVHLLSIKFHDTTTYIPTAKRRDRWSWTNQRLNRHAVQRRIGWVLSFEEVVQLHCEVMAFLLIFQKRPAALQMKFWHHIVHVP